jgi:peptidoglycan/xylan/chitin deacetylase (PgdA/CDA1 family)
MKLPLLAALALAVSVPAALAAFKEPYVPQLPPVWQQHRAIAQVLARGEAVYCGGGHSDAVALTFDDGPGPYTGDIVRILRAAGAHATFFLVGNRIQYWPEGVREEAKLGGIGNHSWSHPHLTSVPPFVVWLELLRTQYAVGQTLGWEPRLFRVPYANHSREVDALARGAGLLEVFWDVDARDDVPHPRVATIVGNVVRGLRPGAIVLLHEIHPWTVQALPQILDAIARRGLRAVSVPELLALDPPAKNQACPYAPVTGD